MCNVYNLVCVFTDLNSFSVIITMSSITPIRWFQSVFPVALLLGLLFVLEVLAAAVTPQQDGNITSTSLSNCFQKSTNFSVAVDADLTCDELNYTKQHCFVKSKSEWSCLEKRASVQNSDTCQCYDKDRATNCGYVEVCAFQNDTFSCQEGNHTCTVVEFGLMRCEVNGNMEYFKCTHSLIFNPKIFLPPKGQLDVVFMKIFKDKCLDNNEGKLKDDIWFYTDRTIHDYGKNVSMSYSVLRSVLAQETTDPSRLCWNEKSVERNMSWISGVVTAVVVLAVAAVGLAIWKYRKFAKAHDKILNLGVEHCKERENFIFSDAENHNNDSTPRIDEKFEKVQINSVGQASHDATSNGDVAKTNEQNRTFESPDEVETSQTSFQNESYTGGNMTDLSSGTVHAGNFASSVQDHNLTGSSSCAEENGSHEKSNTDSVEDSSTMPSNGVNANNDVETASSKDAPSSSSDPDGYYSKDSSTKMSTLPSSATMPTTSSFSHNASVGDSPTQSAVLGEYDTTIIMKI